MATHIHVQLPDGHILTVEEKYQLALKAVLRDLFRDYPNQSTLNSGSWQFFVPEGVTIEQTPPQNPNRAPEP